MSTPEFTPTTEQVRDGYRFDPEAEYRDPITPHHVISGRAFDRWLAEVKAAAWDEGHAAGYEDRRSEGQFLRFTSINPHRTP